jgi:Protein of unknown function (DUF998)
LVSQLLILGGAIGPVFFVVVFLIEGATRHGYGALRQPVSALALGHGGWMQRASFIVTGALTLGFVAGLWVAPTDLGGMRWIASLLGVYSVGLIGSGVFVTDPVGGYPPGIPAPSQPSVTGLLHGLFSLLVFLSLFVACLVAAGLFAWAGAVGWAAYSALTALAFGTGFVLFGRAMSSFGRLGRIAGLLQRTTIVIGWAWIVVLALQFGGMAGH